MALRILFNSWWNAKCLCSSTSLFEQLLRPFGSWHRFDRRAPRSRNMTFHACQLCKSRPYRLGIFQTDQVEWCHQQLSGLTWSNLLILCENQDVCRTCCSLFHLSEISWPPRRFRLWAKLLLQYLKESCMHSETQLLAAHKTSTLPLKDTRNYERSWNGWIR